MTERNIGYRPPEMAIMPENRQKDKLIINLGPGKLPEVLDFALCNAVIRRLSK